MVEAFDGPAGFVVLGVPDDPPGPFPELGAVVPLAPLVEPAPAVAVEVDEVCKTAFIRSVTTIGSVVPSGFLAGA